MPYSPLQSSYYRKRPVFSVVVLGMAAAVCAAVWCLGGGPQACAHQGVDTQAGLPAEVVELIHQAGNVADDRRRLDWLNKVASRSDVPERFRAEAASLAAEINKWITQRNLSYFSRKVGQSLDYDFGVSPDSPLAPIARIYRGRMLVWLTLESGNILHNDKLRRGFLDRARADFEAARQAFPENPVVRMYLGEPIPWTLPLCHPPDAPAWAVWQRENLQRLAAIIHWWIDHRMQADGQFGGGWGDDCEMWRWWTPVLLAFEDPKVVDAQRRFSEAMFTQPHMKAGYTSRMSDVEHTAEDSADTIVPMMELAPDDPAWSARAARLAELMRHQWTGINRRGLLQFRSTYFTADRVDDQPQRACDTAYHVRAVQPALLLWLRSGDPELGSLFAQWMDTWVDAARRTERGKPAGVLPTAIHWPEGTIGGLGEHWWDPQNHGEPTLYRWPSAVSLLCETLLLTHHMTGDPKYLQPLAEMAALRLAYLKRELSGSPEPGNAVWCAGQLGFVAPTLAKYRLLTGDEQFDELLRRDGFAWMFASVAEREEQLARWLQQSAKALSVNFEGYTSEVRYTDRVLRFPVLFDRGMMFAEGVPGFQKPNPSLVYSTATGDPGQYGYFPLNAVRWLTEPRDIAALVTINSRRQFQAKLYHFGPQPRSLGAKLLLLEPGSYRCTLSTGDENGNRQSLWQSEPMSLGPRGGTIHFTLPAQQECWLEVVALSGAG